MAMGGGVPGLDGSAAPERLETAHYKFCGVAGKLSRVPPAPARGLLSTTNR